MNRRAYKLFLHAAVFDLHVIALLGLANYHAVPALVLRVRHAVVYRRLDRNRYLISYLEFLQYARYGYLPPRPSPLG